MQKYYEELARGVALLAEGVDRNQFLVSHYACSPVALLAEGVDRNLVYVVVCAAGAYVALLAEGVDRNRST